MFSKRLGRVQRRHFVLCVFVPHLLVVAWPLWNPDIVNSIGGPLLCLAAWVFVGGVGVSVGFHRHFAHRSFKASTWLRYLMGVAGSMAVQGSLMYWVAMHRRHHAHSDQPGDPHSPQQRANGASSKWKAFVWGHIGWLFRHDVPRVSRYAPDLAADSVARWISNTYWYWVGAGLLVPGIFGAALWGGIEGFARGVYWGGFARVVAGQHVTWAINSVCHSLGRRPHALIDKSTNVVWLSLISFGESWHNNHHHRATSARFGANWKQPDVGWVIICIFRKCSWVHSVRD